MQLKHRKYIYLCNALDDVTRQNRRISTDSPAASNKVFALCRALRSVGSQAGILSMGRGRQGGGRDGPIIHRCAIRRNSGVSIIYTEFWNIPIFTHLVTAFSMVRVFLALAKKYKVVLVAYNRQWHYIPTLCFAYVMRIPCFLDLEDGYIGLQKKVNEKFLAYIFHVTCGRGAILACSALSLQVKSDNHYICYGVAEPTPYLRNWNTQKIQILFGGTLSLDTGTQLFIDAVRLLFLERSTSLEYMQFVVTGKGSMAEALAGFAKSEGSAHVDFRGSVTHAEYKRLMAESHIGLCLKLPSSDLNHTTFPSKVIELAAHGLALVTTPVSDVSKIFSDKDALFLRDESPATLAKALEWLVQHRLLSSLVAKHGQEAVLRCCSRQNVGIALRGFLGKEDIELKS